MNQEYFTPPELCDRVFVVGTLGASFGCPRCRSTSKMAGRPYSYAAETRVQRGRVPSLLLERGDVNSDSLDDVPTPHII